MLIRNNKCIISYRDRLQEKEKEENRVSYIDNPMPYISSVKNIARDVAFWISRENAR